MPLDPSIPLRAAQGAQVNLADIYAQHDARKMQEQAMQQRDQEMALRTRQLDIQERQFLDQLDERQREATAEGVKDMAAAVQWAQTPEQWAVVQQHYGRYDPQLAAIPFESREQALVKLGQMGEYLEQTAPKIMAIDAGGSLAAVDPRTGQPTFTVLPNPGGAQPGAPVGGEERKTVGGRNFVKRGGQWFEETGGSNAAGGFQP